MKKILVSGYIGFNNFGDEAIFYALSNHLKQLGHKVSVLCNNTDEVIKKYNVDAFYFKNPSEIIKAMLNCDILISGGGSLLQNKTSNFSLFYYLLIILFAKLCFKKVIIFSQGIEPIIGNFQTFITKIILKFVNHITVRDEKSLELLKKWNLKAELTSDPAYSLVQDMKISNSKSGLIVQLRKYNGINDVLLEKLSNSISKYYKEDVNVFSFQDEIDEEVCKRFTEKLNQKGIKAKYISNKSIQETINIVNNAQYMISTRLHGLIISNALQNNTFALIYDKKIKTISEELNLQNIDILNYTDEELDEKINLFFNSKLNNGKFRRYDWNILDSKLN